MRFCSSIIFAWLLASSVNAFAPSSNSKRVAAPYSSFMLQKTSAGLRAAAAEEEGEKKEENPYQDPNYPDLEFVNYADPEYQVDQGVGDEFFDPESTEAQIETMREERRLRNDEFQYETYYKEILKEGQEYKGEWTVYHTSTFGEGVDDNSMGVPPKLKKIATPLKVISRGERVEIELSESSDFRLDKEHILHHEKVFSESDEEKSPIQLEQEEKSINSKFWPAELSARDFRGQQGIMCVGNCYTICTGVQLEEANGKVAHEGPFSEYRAELGIQSDLLRCRVKLDYSVLEKDQKSMDSPPLHLRSMTVCREALGMWPRAENYTSAIEAVTERAFYGPPGAAGGLYDPPPVGSDEQATQYMMLDLDGGATLLLPYKMDQDPSVHGEDSGWVTSLDWTPGSIRFQADRKIKGGKEILGLRTLELSEIQGEDASVYRPADGGSNMLQ